MTQDSDISWSSRDKKIAEEALKKAYEREVAALISYVQEKAKLLTVLEDVWQLHTFLSASRHDIDGKYDDAEPSLAYILSRLIKDGWLDSSELEGLSTDKRAKVTILTRI
ncbi:hypothetical protein Lepto7375DRAFT_0201 [Leptolyngbya sp. PCC 7375]|nr:hypothetical protein Lepto7375DRAFT_0201 [Leptolyngbya sp. PCC 7375]